MHFSYEILINPSGLVSERFANVGHGWLRTVALALIAFVVVCFFASIFFLYVLLQWMRETKRTANVLAKTAVSKRAIKSEAVLLEGWVVLEGGKQIGAFITRQEAIAFRDRHSADEDDAPDN